MPLKSVVLDPAPGQLVQVCAACRAERALPLDGLLLGVDEGAMAVNCILLPVCPCGAREYLIRTWEETAPIRPGVLALHRAAINALAQYLKSKGQSHPSQQAAHAAETTVPLNLATLPVLNVPMPLPSSGPMPTGLSMKE